MQDLRRRWKRRPFDRLFESSAVGNVLRKVAARFWEPSNRREVQWTSRKTRRGSFALETMEPRLLLSGDPVVTLAAASVVQISQHNDHAADGGSIVDVTVNNTVTTYGNTTTGIHAL